MYLVEGSAGCVGANNWDGQGRARKGKISLIALNVGDVYDTFFWALGVTFYCEDVPRRRGLYRVSHARDQPTHYSCDP